MSTGIEEDVPGSGEHGNGGEVDLADRRQGEDVGCAEQLGEPLLDGRVEPRTSQHSGPARVAAPPAHRRVDRIGDRRLEVEAEVVAGGEVHVPVRTDPDPPAVDLVNHLVPQARALQAGNAVVPTPVVPRLALGDLGHEIIGVGHSSTVYSASSENPSLNWVMTRPHSGSSGSSKNAQNSQSAAEQAVGGMMSMSKRIWWGYWGLASVLVVLYMALPALSFLLSAALSVTGTCGVVVGVLRNRPRRAAPWLLWGGSILAFGAGSTTAVVLAEILHKTAFPSVADVIFLG